MYVYVEVPKLLGDVDIGFFRDEIGFGLTEFWDVDSETTCTKTFVSNITWSNVEPYLVQHWKNESWQYSAVVKVKQPAYEIM